MSVKRECSRGGQNNLLYAHIAQHLCELINVCGSSPSRGTAVDGAESACARGLGSCILGEERGGCRSERSEGDPNSSSSLYTFLVWQPM